MFSSPSVGTYLQNYDEYFLSIYGKLEYQTDLRRTSVRNISSSSQEDLCERTFCIRRDQNRN